MKSDAYSRFVPPVDDLLVGKKSTTRVIPVTEVDVKSGGCPEHPSDACLVEVVLRPTVFMDLLDVKSIPAGLAIGMEDRFIGPRFVSVIDYVDGVCIQKALQLFGIFRQRDLFASEMAAYPWTSLN